ncbi:hypothetical protein [Mesorhizobium loti]|uniref:hypothetical protein n=1 Tax=Rhizobium loti TaxID=381 RepID=UPI001495746A|nr:hypothetical protein [Mesorhizobium loti]
MTAFSASSIRCGKSGVPTSWIAAAIFRFHGAKPAITTIFCPLAGLLEPVRGRPNFRLVYPYRDIQLREGQP